MADDIDNEDLEGLDVSAEADAEDEDIDDGDKDPVELKSVES